MLSERYSSGYIAKELGLPVIADKFYFGLANEADPKTSKKFRVIIAREDLLSRAHEMSGPPKFQRSYHRGRWDTVKNMANLLADYKVDKKRWKNAPLREIELVLPKN